VFVLTDGNKGFLDAILAAWKAGATEEHTDAKLNQRCTKTAELASKILAYLEKRAAADTALTTAISKADGTTFQHLFSSFYDYGNTRSQLIFLPVPASVVSEAIKTEMKRLEEASKNGATAMSQLHGKHRKLSMELQTAKEDVTLAEERAKDAEKKEQEASAENMLLRRQVHQLKEANANGLSRAPSATSTKSGASKEEPEEKKGVKREREEDGGGDESNKRANQELQAELEKLKSVAESRLKETAALWAVQRELQGKVREFEAQAKEISDEEAIKSSAYTVLNFKYNEALRDQVKILITPCGNPNPTVLTPAELHERFIF